MLLAMCRHELGRRRCGERCKRCGFCNKEVGVNLNLLEIDGLVPDGIPMMTASLVPRSHL